MKSTRITIDIDAPMPVIDEMLASLRAELDESTDQYGDALGSTTNKQYVEILRHKIWLVEQIIKDLRAGNHFIGTMSAPRPAFKAQEEVEPEASTGGPTFKWPSEFALGLGFDPSETTD